MQRRRRRRGSSPKCLLISNKLACVRRTTGKSVSRRSLFPGCLCPFETEEFTVMTSSIYSASLVGMRRPDPIDRSICLSIFCLPALWALLACYRHETESARGLRNSAPACMHACTSLRFRIIDHSPRAYIATPFPRHRPFD